MKKTCLFILFFCCFSMLSIPVSSTNRDIAEEIDLMGNLTTTQQRSFINPPVQAFIHRQQFLEVDFNATLGSIDVFIYDERGNAVYQQSVTAYAGQQILIDTAFFNQGNYSIKFTNSQGRSSEGTFEIE